MFFCSVKARNKLITKGMPNVYLKVTIEKNGDSWNFLNSEEKYELK